MTENPRTSGIHPSRRLYSLRTPVPGDFKTGGTSTRLRNEVVKSQSLAWQLPDGRITGVIGDLSANV
jgi:hypothetical protein